MRLTKQRTIPFKAWKIQKALELGTTVKAVEARLYRGQLPWPLIVKRNGTVVDVAAEEKS